VCALAYPVDNGVVGLGSEQRRHDRLIFVLDRDLQRPPTVLRGAAARPPMSAGPRLARCASARPAPRPRLPFRCARGGGQSMPVTPQRGRPGAFSLSVSASPRTRPTPPAHAAPAAARALAYLVGDVGVRLCVNQRLHHLRPAELHRPMQRRASRQAPVPIVLLTRIRSVPLSMRLRTRAARPPRQTPPAPDGAALASSELSRPLCAAYPPVYLPRRDLCPAAAAPGSVLCSSCYLPSRTLNARARV